MYAQQGQPNITTVALSFAGPILYPASKQLRSVCCNAVTQGAKNIQILFSSSGGLMEDGFALHHFLRALPVSLSMHCVGVADSAALLVFLAGEKRYCNTDSTFLFHDATWNFAANQMLTAPQVNEIAESMTIYRMRSMEMLKSRANFTDEDFKTLQLYDKSSVKNAAFAKEKGIVHEIKEATITAGVPVFNVEY